MRLDTRALAITSAVVWGGCILLVGVSHLIWPGYGVAFLDMAASIYPGFHVAGIGSVVVGALYGVVDGAIGGAIFGWCYNRLAQRSAAT